MERIFNAAGLLVVTLIVFSWLYVAFKGASSSPMSHEQYWEYRAR